MYKAAFWVLIFITFITLVFQISGYNILETLVFLIIVDFLALWLYLEKRKSLAEVNNEFVKKVENLENSCLSILENINAVSSVLNLEEKVNKQREDLSMELEKINKKTLELEEKINKFSYSLVSSLEKKDIE
ncbi:MAG: hypothetical protein QXK49_01790 [Candidatus Aenigmatarchaeota archaeon]